MQEAVKSQWSTRQFERQINPFFYKRLLSSKNKEQVAEEIQKLEPVKEPEHRPFGRHGFSCLIPFCLSFLCKNREEKFKNKTYNNKDKFIVPKK